MLRKLGIAIAVLGAALVLAVCLRAIAEPMPQLYPDAEEFLTAGGLSGDLKMLGFDLYLDADSDSRWENGTDDQTALYLNAAGPQCLITTAAATWAVQAIFSGVTADITTATNEHLQLAPNGTGDIILGTDADSFVVTNTNEDLTIDPNGSGDVIASLDSGAGSYLELQSTATGVTGPTMIFRYADGTPTADDGIGGVQYYSTDSAANAQHYGSQFGVLVDPTSTSEDFRLDTWAYIGGAEKKVQELGMTTQGAGMSLPLADDGALGPTLGFAHNSASPLAADVLGRVIFAGKDSGAADQEFVRLEAINVDPTAAGEDGRIDIKPFVGGSQLTVASVGAVPNYAGTLVAGVAGQNGEYVTNTADGDICFGGNGGTNPEEVCFDLDFEANVIAMKSGTSGTNVFAFNTNIRQADNYSIAFGTAGYSGSPYLFNNSVPALKNVFTLGLNGSSSNSRTFLIADGAANGVDFGIPDQTTPTLVMQWGPCATPTACTADEKLKRFYLQHDATGGKIAVDAGTIHADLPTLTAAQTADAALIVNQTLNDPTAADPTMYYQGIKMNLTDTSHTHWGGGVYGYSLYKNGAKYFSVDYNGAVVAYGGLQTTAGSVLIGSTAGSGLKLNTTASQQALISTDISGGGSDHNLVYGTYAYSGRDYDHVQQTNPTLWIHSAVDPDTDNTQWLSLAHDQTDGVITTGKGDLVLSPATSVVAISGTTNAYPAWKRNAANMEARLADDSASTGVIASGYSANGASAFYALDCGTTCESGAISLVADNTTTPQETTIQTIHGGDPYLRISAPNDAGAATATLDIHDTVISFGTGTADVDYRIDVNGQSADGSITYMEDEDRFDFDTTVQAPYFQSTAADPADSGVVRLGNAESVCWEANPTSTDVCMNIDSSERLAFTGMTQLLLADDVEAVFGNGPDLVIGFQTDQTPDSAVIGLGTDTESLIVCDYADRNTDFAHADQNDPTFFFQSSDANDPQQFATLTWDMLAHTVGTLGAKTSSTGAQEELTCAGGGGSATLVTTSLIPDGAILHGVTTRITTALTGSTGYSVGDGADADLYGVEATATLGATTDNSDATANWGNPQLAAGEVTITFAGGNCTAGKVAVVAHYTTVTAPSVNAVTP